MADPKMASADDFESPEEVAGAGTETAQRPAQSAKNACKLPDRGITFRISSLISQSQN